MPHALKADWVIRLAWWKFLFLISLLSVQSIGFRATEAERMEEQLLLQQERG